MSVLESQATEPLVIRPASREVTRRQNSRLGSGRITPSLIRSRQRKKGPIASSASPGGGGVWDTAIWPWSPFVVGQPSRGMTDSSALLLDGCGRRSLSCCEVPTGCRDEAPGAPKRRSNLEQGLLLIGETDPFPDFDDDEDSSTGGEVKSSLDNVQETEIGEEEEKGSSSDGDSDDDDRVLLWPSPASDTNDGVVASECFHPAEDDANTSSIQGNTDDVTSFRAFRRGHYKRRHSAKGSRRDGRGINTTSPPANNTSRGRWAPSRATKLARSLFKRLWKRASPAERSKDNGLSLCKPVSLQSGADEYNDTLHGRFKISPRSTVDVSATTMAPFGDMGAVRTAVSSSWWAVASTGCSMDSGPPASDSAGEHLKYRKPPNGRPAKIHRDGDEPEASYSATGPVLYQQRCLLLLLRHVVGSCFAENGSNENYACAMSPHCATVRKLWDHVAVCVDAECPVSFDGSVIRCCCCYRS